MLRADIKIYRGDDKRLKFNVFQNGQPFNVVGSRFSMTVAPEKDGEAITLTTESGSIQAFENYVVVHFSHDMTKDLTWARGEYDLQMTTSLGDVRTIARGRVTLIHDITR